jgi:glycosyltransferase involved in cell wall biosynthesis
MADIFVLLSDYEGLPMTIIEAMSFGKPIISSNVGGVSEIVHDGENGYLLPNDASAFAEKIRFLIENNEVYASMSETSEKIFHERMNIEKMIGGYMKIYNSLL